MEVLFNLLIVITYVLVFLSAIGFGSSNEGTPAWFYVLFIFVIVSIPLRHTVDEFGTLLVVMFSGIMIGAIGKCLPRINFDTEDEIVVETN